jgi:hypothetical protein
VSFTFEATRKSAAGAAGAAATPGQTARGRYFRTAGQVSRWLDQGKNPRSWTAGYLLSRSRLRELDPRDKRFRHPKKKFRHPKKNSVTQKKIPSPKKRFRHPKKDSVTQK